MFRYLKIKIKSMANLHLVVDDSIKKDAKKIAEKQGKNLSELVESFLFEMVRKERGIEIAPELIKLPKLKLKKGYEQEKAEYLDKKYGKI